MSFVLHFSPLLSSLRRIAGPSLISKPMRPSKPAEQPASQIHRGQTKFVPPELRNRREVRSESTAQSTPTEAEAEEEASTLSKGEQDEIIAPGSKAQEISGVAEEASAEPAPEPSPVAQNGLSPHAEIEEAESEIAETSEEQVPSTSGTENVSDIEDTVEDVLKTGKEDQVEDQQADEDVASSSGRSVFLLWGDLLDD